MQFLDLFNSSSYTILFLTIFINLVILNYRNSIANILNIFDIPNERKIHKIPTPLVGGICIFVTILIITIFLFSNSLISKSAFILYLFFYLIFFTIGLWDDAKTLSPKIKTFIILSSSLVLILFENNFLLKELIFKSYNNEIQLGIFSYFFTLFCIFALYNALNFIDGYNGSAISITIFWTFILLIKSPNLLYLFVIINMIIIFLYNLNSKIFLGNSGTSILSIFITLSIIHDYNIIKSLYADEILLMLLFPGIDMIRVTFERIINNKKIYFADKSHFHHYLIKKKFKYIWQFILILTISPLIIFYFFKNMFGVLLISILVYFILLINLRSKK